MGYLRDFTEHVAESFNTLFNLDADPALTEHENVERVIGHTATVACIVSILQPIPAADFLVLTPIQAKMALHIGKTKGFEVTQERAQEIVVEIIGVLGMTLTAQLLIVSVAKLVPIVGGVLSGPLIYAATWAIGNVVDYYFDCLRTNKAPSREVMKDLFTEQFRVGKQKGQALDRSELERKAEELRRKVAERDSDLQHETRIPTRESARPPGPSAFAGGPPPPPPLDGGRRKIKITLGGAERDGGRRSDERVGGRGKKTIGFDDDLPGDDAPELEDEPAVEPAAPRIEVKSLLEPAAAEEVAARIEVKSMIERAPEPRPGGASPPRTPASAGEPGFIDQLERLGRLRQAGVLTTEEFEQAKRKILGLG